MRTFAQGKASQQIASVRSPDRGRARAEGSGTIQSTRAINASGGIFDEEADRVSEQLMRMPEPHRPRVCACGGGCPRCRSNQARHESRGKESRSTHSGAPLPPGLRNFFEDQFGHDLSLVRIHAGKRAAVVSALLSADAYTIGHDISFAEGRYDPSSTEGMRLLAHELTHVLQQTSLAPPAGLTSTAGPLVQCNLAGYVTAMNAKPEPAWQEAALHLHGESEATTRIILARLTPFYRARLHRAALRSPGKNSIIGKMTLADYNKVFPEEAAAESAAETNVEAQAKAAAVPAIPVVAHGKGTRVEAAIGLLKRAKALDLAGDHDGAQATLAKISEFVDSITADKNFDRRFAEATGAGLTRARSIIQEARSAVARLRSKSAPPSAGTWDDRINRFAITKQDLEILTGERTYAGSPVAQAYEEAVKNATIAAGIVAGSILAVPVIIAGAPAIAQLAVSASGIATVLAVEYPTASLIAAEMLFGAAIQIHEAGSFSLDPYQILSLIVTIRGARYRGSGRVTGSGGGRVTVQITNLKPADEGTHRVAPQRQWITGYPAPATPETTAAKVPPVAAPRRSVPALPTRGALPSLPAPPLEEPVAAPPRQPSSATAQRARAAAMRVAIGLHEATDLGRVAPRTEIPAAAAAAVASPPRTQWTAPEPGQRRAAAAAAPSVPRPSGPQIAAPAPNPSLEAAKEAVRTGGPTQANLFNLLNALPPRQFEELKLALAEVGMPQERLDIIGLETQAEQAKTIATAALNNWKEPRVPQKLVDRALRTFDKEAARETERAHRARVDAAKDALRKGGPTQENLFNLLKTLSRQEFEQLKEELYETGMPQDYLDLLEIPHQLGQSLRIAQHAVGGRFPGKVPEKLAAKALAVGTPEGAAGSVRAGLKRQEMQKEAKEALRRGGPTQENLFNLLTTLSPREFEQLKEELHETGMPQEYLDLPEIPNQRGQSLRIAQHAVGGLFPGKVPEKLAAKALAVGTPEGTAGSVRAERKRQEMLKEAKEALRKGGPTREHLYNVMKNLTPREFRQLKASLRDIGMDEAYLPTLEAPTQMGQAMVIADEALRGSWGDVKNPLMLLLLRSY